jgi:hypothetical protein
MGYAGYSYFTVARTTWSKMRSPNHFRINIMDLAYLPAA